MTVHIVHIEPTLPGDIRAFCGILSEYDPGLFWPDTLRIETWQDRTKEELWKWWISFALDSVTARDSDCIVGGGFLDHIEVGNFASVNVFTRKGYRNPWACSDIARQALPDYFDTYKLKKLVGYIPVHHTASIRFAERCGFQQDSISKKHMQINGKRVDCVVMTISKENIWKSDGSL